MSQERIPGPPAAELAATARVLLRDGTSGVLSTLSLRKAGWPLGTLVSYALDEQGRPLFLFSEMSQHTRNLRADPRASLFVQEAGARKPQSAPRMAVLGTVAPVPGGEAEAARAAYVAVHKEGDTFADLGDFLFWRMTVEDVHVVGGFAQAGWLAAAQLAEGGSGT
jgi:putative heme iron utilization protein